MAAATATAFAAVPDAAATRAAGASQCQRPVAHRVGDCRYGRHGTPDLSRSQWRHRRGAEVSISVRIMSLARNVKAAGAALWPLVDSLGLPLGMLSYDRAWRRFVVVDSHGRTLRVSSVRVRGRGCMADPAQQGTHTLVQVHASGSSSGGTQAFLDIAALDGPDAPALAAFHAQRGTGCGPSGRVRGRTLALRDPAVGATAHARLSNGALNSVDEYDAKPDFANVVYLMTNTTSVHVGGIVRGMVRVGTPVAKVDQIEGCDPNSDGTLTWRYLRVTTSLRQRPAIYGWIPARCRTRTR